MNETIVSNLVAKLTLDTSGFTSAANSINTNSVQKNVKSAVDDIDIDIKHMNLLSDAEEIQQTNAHLDQTLETLDRAQEFGRSVRETMQTWVSTARDIETAWVGVTKTVNAPEGVDPDKYFGDLKNEVYRLSTEIPSTFQEISAAMSTAAANGIPTESLLDFTEAMLQFESATNGAVSAAEASQIFAQINKLTKGSTEEIDNLASSVVELGNHFGTQEKPVMNMALAISSAGHNFGLTNDQIVGWSAAMVSTGLSAQSAGRAFRSLTTQMSDAVKTGNADLEVFAKTAGMTSSDFVKYFEDDASKALLAFIEGLDSDNLSAIFESLHIGMDQEKLLMTNLANSSDKATEALNMSADAYKENTALVDEAAAANDTLDAQIKMMENSIQALSGQLGESLLPVIKDISKELLPILQNVTAFISEHPGLAGTITGIAIAFQGVAIAAQTASIAMAMGALGLAPWLGAIGIIGALVGVVVLLANAFGESQKMAAATVEEIENMNPAVDNLTEIAGQLYITPKFVNTEEAVDVNGEEFGIGTWVQWDDMQMGWVRATDEEVAILNERLQETQTLANEAANSFSENSVGEQIADDMNTTEEAISGTDDILKQLEQQMNSVNEMTKQTSQTMSEDFTQPMNDLNKMMESGLLQQYANQPVDASVMESWSSFGESVNKVSEGFESITSQMSGAEMTISFPAIQDSTVKSYSGFKDVIEGINTAIGNLSAAISGESLQAFKDFVGTKFDDSMLESWQLLEEALSGVGNALMSIMIVLTGGEFGEEGELGALGDKQAGQPLIEGFQAFATAAAELAPLIDSSINGVMKNLASYTSTIYDKFNAIIVLWRTDFKSGVKIFEKEALKAEAVTERLKTAANDAAGTFKAWADAIRDVIDALKKLAEIQGQSDGSYEGADGARASGGPVRHGDTYLVGEEGPELFTPHRSGYIVPNDDLMNGKSASQEIKIEINGNIYGESYLEEFVVGTMTNAIRREMSYAS